MNAHTPLKIDGRYVCRDCHRPVEPAHGNAARKSPPVRCYEHGRKNYEDRRRARYAASLEVARAIRKGAMLPPAAFECVDCGAKATEYDHRDYTKPLQVDPVCRRCNHKRGPALVWPEGYKNFEPRAA